MQEIRAYLIEIQGQLEEMNINTMSPYLITELRSDPEASMITICADQSGLIGFLRYLHQKGFVFLSIRRNG